METTVEHRIPATNTERKGEYNYGFSIPSAEYSGMINLYGEINRAYHRFFPEIYVDPKVQKLDVYRSGKLANGGFTGMGRILRMDLGEDAGDSGKIRLNANYDMGNSEYVMEVPRRLGELVLMSHEIAHGIFVQSVNPDNYTYKEDSNGQTEFKRLEEGFASTMGHMFLEKLIANPEVFNLSPADTDTLVQFLAMRQSPQVIADASPVQILYKEGIKIIDDIYNDKDHTMEGSGDPGLLRIKEVLKFVKPNEVIPSRIEEERRKALYYTILANQGPQGATAKWIEFIKDKNVVTNPSA